MSETDKKILKACGELVPRLSELEKAKFLSFTEGMAFLNARLTNDSASRPEVRK